MKTDYTKRTSRTHSIDMSYELEFAEVSKSSIGHCRRENEIRGVIYYVFNGKKSTPMTWGSVNEVRRSWHDLCRRNRAKNNGRPYLHMINKQDQRIKNAVQKIAP